MVDIDRVQRAIIGVLGIWVQVDFGGVADKDIHL